MPGILLELLWLFSRDYPGSGWIVRSVKTPSALFVCSLSHRHGVPLRFTLLRTVFHVLVILWAGIFYKDIWKLLLSWTFQLMIPILEVYPLIESHEPPIVKDESPSLSSSVSLDCTPQVDCQDLNRSSWRGMFCHLEDGEGLVLAYGRIQASQSEDVLLASLLDEEDVGVVVTSVPSGDDSDVMSLRR